MRAILPWCAAKLAAEFPREMTLIEKAATLSHFRQRLAGVDQRMARDPHAQFSQIPLRREMKAALELSFEGADGHMRQPRQVDVGDRRPMIIAHVRQDRAEFVSRNHLRVCVAESPRNPGGSDDRSILSEQGDLVGHLPAGGAIMPAKWLDAIHDSIARQDVVVIQLILVGQNRGANVMVRLPENVVDSVAVLRGRAMSGSHHDDRAVHPEKATFPVLCPGEYIVDVVEQFGELKEFRVGDRRLHCTGLVKSFRYGQQASKLPPTALCRLYWLRFEVLMPWLWSLRVCSTLSGKLVTGFGFEFDAAEAVACVSRVSDPCALRGTQIALYLLRIQPP
jgi:hypothetical protein